MPRDVTVIMGAYNVESFVAAALASIREQTHEDLAVVVVDAGSTDATAEVVAHCAGQDGRIHLTRATQRLLAPQARNAALAEVQTEFVATLDADDLMLPDRVADQLSTLRAHPDTVAVGGLLREVDPHGLPLRSMPTQDDRTNAKSAPVGTPSPEALAASPTTIQYAMPFRCPFLASAGMYRTDALRRIGGFDDFSPWADDYTTIWRLSQVGAVRRLPKYVGEYRRHRGSITARRRHSQGLEVALLRQKIAAATMGRPPSIASVLAWTTPLDAVPPDTIALARDELVELHEAFLADHAVDGDDEVWIRQFHLARLARFTVSDQMTAESIA